LHSSFTKTCGLRAKLCGAFEPAYAILEIVALGFVESGIYPAPIPKLNTRPQPRNINPVDKAEALYTLWVLLSVISYLTPVYLSGTSLKKTSHPLVVNKPTNYAP
jgi:hypothetical protein